MKKIVLTTLLILHTNLTFAEGNFEVGKDKSIICIGCHGVDGNSSNPDYPHLAGQHQTYLSKQLFDFKTGARVDEHMSAMIEAIDMANIPDITAFFSSQKRKNNTVKIEAIEKNKIELGRQFYQTGIKAKNIPACISCHGENGQGNSAAAFPALTLQHGEYVSKALKDFRSKRRNNDSNAIMRDTTAKLSDNEIDALTSYIEHLK